MATLYCSHKMAKWLGTATPLPEDPPEINTWNTNLFKIERKNWLIAVHNPTAYILLFSEIKKADTQNFGLWFYPRLSEQFHYDGIEPELATLFPSSEMAFYKTNNHSRTIGMMNSHVTNLKYYTPYWGGSQTISLTEANHRMNTTPMRAGKRDVFFPIDAMKEFLSGSAP